MLQKIKSFYSSHKEELYVSLIMVFVGTASYGVGYLSAKTGHPPISIRYNEEQGTNQVKVPSTEGVSVPKESSKASQSASAVQSLSQNEQGGEIVASKNGTAYYLPGCSGSSRILDKNKIYFKTEDEAKAAGYHLAGNCKR